LGVSLVQSQIPRCGWETIRDQIPVNAALETRITGNHTASIQSRSLDAIPLVFHIVWHSPQENISNLQIHSQIDALNRDFSARNENIPGLPSRFRDVAFDTGIRFCLAQVNPSGEEQTGIVRVQTDNPDIANSFDLSGRRMLHYSNLGGSGAWDPSRYVNIWVTALEGLLGFAYMPGEAPFQEEDGIVMHYGNTGSFNIPEDAFPYDKGHSLSHEMGHYFGLFHIWGEGNGSCDTDDFVEDTPNQALPYFGCPEIPQFSCGTEDYFMNIMDFTDDRCLAFFTAGQTQRMQEVINDFRTGLLVPSASVCTGANPEPVPALAENIIVSYAQGEHKLLVQFRIPVPMPVDFRFFSYDGKQIVQEEILNNYTFWLPSESMPPGIYIAYFEQNHQRHAIRIPVF
jgi:hypothetical protein